MFVWIAAIIGAIFGGFQAKRRGGNRLDIAQYAAGYGIAFFVAGLIIWIVIVRTAL